MTTITTSESVGTDGDELTAEANRGAKPSALGRLAERGMVSAEWAVGLIAAIAIAGVLIVVLTSGQVEETLLDVIVRILKSIVGKL